MSMFTDLLNILNACVTEKRGLIAEIKAIEDRELKARRERVLKLSIFIDVLGDLQRCAARAVFRGQEPVRFEYCFLVKDFEAVADDSRYGDHRKLLWCDRVWPKELAQGVQDCEARGITLSELADIKKIPCNKCHGQAIVYGRYWLDQDWGPSSWVVTLSAICLDCLEWHYKIAERSEHRSFNFSKPG